MERLIASVLLGFVTVMCAVLPAQAQQTSCQRRILVASFTSEQLLPISGVAPTDLEAKIQGKRVTILSLAPDERPHRLLILLDSSGSMMSYWATATKFAQMFANENAGTSQLALMASSRGNADIVDFSEGNSAVSAKLQELAMLGYEKKDVRGMTAIRDAIVQAVQLFHHPTSADAIYLITDGEENASKHNTEFVEHLLSRTSVRLFVTVVGHGHDGPVFPIMVENEDLAEMSKDSGGGVLGYLDWNDSRLFLEADARYPVDLPPDRALARLFQVISRDEVVQVQLPESIRKFEHLKLKFSREARKRWKGARITFPQLLPPCAGQRNGAVPPDR